MKSSELLFDVITGGSIPVADHPLFGEVWDKAANAYNEFVEELDLNDEQMSKLQTLIDYKCAVERLGYYSALQVGFEASATDMKRAELLFEYLSMEDVEQRRVLGFVKGLVDGKKKRQAS
jgi:hypothetical protein